MKTSKRFLSIIVVFAVMASLVSCSRTAETDVEPEEEEETEPFESVYGEEDQIPLSSELLNGTWITEDGFFCKFDMDEMVFSDQWGMNYSILSIEDDHLMIEMIYPDYTYFSPASVLPVYDVIELDVACYDDALTLLGKTCYRTDSSYGGELAEELISRVAGHTFTIGTYAGGIIWSFNEDMSAIDVQGLGTSISCNIESFDGGCLAYTDETGVYNEFLVRYVGEDMVWCGSGNIIQITDNQIADASDWLMYDADDDEITVLEFSGQDGKGPGNVPVLLGINGAQDMSYLGQSFTSMYVCDGMYVNGSRDVFMIDMANPYAWELMRRAEYGGTHAGGISPYEYVFGGGSVVFDKYEDEWPCDVVDVSLADSYYPRQAFPDYDTSMVISEFYDIEIREDREAVLSFDFDSPSSTDVYVCLITDDEEIIPLETSVVNGTASAVINESGAYCLSYNIEQYDDITEENYFAADPHDTAWGRSDEAGDIPDLVDMEYIEQSYNSVFVVDSAEDLASLTYFINTYPRDYEDNFFVWVDLVEDIDLSEYLWAPMGTEDLMFCGIFCGNGHTIRGLTIGNDNLSNGFFGDMYFSNVVGLNIEEAFITGASSHIMCADTSTTDFIDCHVEGILPDNTATGVDLFPDYSDYGNNGYHYCSYDITNGAGMYFYDEFSSNYPHPNQENDVENHFDPDGDGVFDYSEDYFFD